jgi:hypothetical protein
MNILYKAKSQRTFFGMFFGFDYLVITATAQGILPSTT